MNGTSGNYGSSGTIAVKHRGKDHWFWILGVCCQQPKAAGLRAEKGPSASSIECQGLFYLTV